MPSPMSWFGPLVATFNNGASLAYSTDEWNTIASAASFSNIVVAGAPIVCSSAASASIIYAAQVFSTYAIVAAAQGLIAYNLGNGATTVLLATCIQDVQTRPLSSIAAASCPTVYATSSAEVWAVNATSLAVTLLTDANGMTFDQFMGLASGSYTIIASRPHPFQCGTVSILLDVSSTYKLVGLQQGQWTISFSFPAALPLYTPLSACMQVFNNTGLYIPLDATVTVIGTRPLVLQGIVFSESMPGDLFAYGSVVLHSPDLGESQYLMHSLAGNESIVSLAGGILDSTYTYLSDANNLYAGKTTSSHNVQLIQTSNLAQYVGYNSTGNVYTLNVASNAVTATFWDFASLWDLASLALWVADPTTLPGVSPLTACPYSLLVASGSMDPMYTRTYAGVGASPDLRGAARIILPPAIYLDYKDSYNFTVDLVAASGVALSGLQLTVRESGSLWSWISMARAEHPEDNRVSYSISIVDKGTYPYQQFSGDLPAVASVALSVKGGEYCSSGGDTIGPILIYTGCAPGQQIVTSMPTTQMCLNPDPAVPCLYLENDYLPLFQLFDTVTANSQNFTDYYTLQVTGGGPPPGTDITTYSTSGLTTLNANTWTPSNDLPQLSDGRFVYNRSMNGVVFACNSGSPCNAVMPTFPNPAEYYLQLTMSTRNVSSTTYCRFDVTYKVRLYGLNVDFATSLIATGATMAITIGLVLLLALFRRYKQVKTLLTVAPAGHDLFDINAGLETAPLIGEHAASPTQSEAPPLSPPPPYAGLDDGRGIIGEKPYSSAIGPLPTLEVAPEEEWAAAHSLAMQQQQMRPSGQQMRQILRTSPAIPEEES